MSIGKHGKARGRAHQGRYEIKSLPKSNSVRRQKPIKEKAFAGAGIALKQDLVETLETRPRMVRKVLNRLAEAAKEVELSRESVIFTVEVSPDQAEPEITAVPNKGDALDTALTAARQRGSQYIASIMKGDDMLPGRVVASLIGASAETVNQKRKTGELLGLEGATRGVRFPKWQITDDGRPLLGLKSLFAILEGNPWTVFRFLIQHHNELGGRTALDEMKAGRLSEVEDVARNMKDGVFA